MSAARYFSIKASIGSLFGTNDAEVSVVLKPDGGALLTASGSFGATITIAPAEMAKLEEQLAIMKAARAPAKKP